MTKEGGQLIRDRIWSQKTVEFKSCEVDLVTETDKKVEKLLIFGLKSRFPEHKFIGEESTAAGIRRPQRPTRLLKLSDRLQYNGIM